MDSDSRIFVAGSQGVVGSAIRKKLEEGDFEDKIIEVEVADEPTIGMQVFGPMGMEDIGMNIKDMISSSLPKNKRSKKMKVSEAREVLTDSEALKLIDRPLEPLHHLQRYI